MRFAGKIEMTDSTMYQITSAENAEINDETPNTTVLEGGTTRGLQPVDGENFNKHRIYYNTAAEYAPIDEEESGTIAVATVQTTALGVNGATLPLVPKAADMHSCLE